MLMIKTGGKRDEHALFRLDHSIESSEIELPSLVIVIEGRLRRAWNCRLSRGVAVELPADLLLLAAKTRWVLLQQIALCAHQAGSVVLSHLLL